MKMKIHYLLILFLFTVLLPIVGLKASEGDSTNINGDYNPTIGNKTVSKNTVSTNRNAMGCGSWRGGFGKYLPA